jgi:undecaprenyl pyrophosphate phosphatase UppP
MAAKMFKILLGIDALAAATVGYFFTSGLADGSISDFNIRLWMGILLAISTIIIGGIMLRKATKPALANVVLAVLAVPAILYGIFILAVVVTGAQWN